MSQVDRIQKRLKELEVEKVAARQKYRKNLALIEEQYKKAVADKNEEIVRLQDEQALHEDMEKLGIVEKPKHCRDMNVPVKKPMKKRNTLVKRELVDGVLTETVYEDGKKVSSTTQKLDKDEVLEMLQKNVAEHNEDIKNIVEMLNQIERQMYGFFPF